MLPRSNPLGYIDRWKNRKTSFWKILIDLLEKGNSKGCINIIKQLESLVVPRRMYRNLYINILELSLKYGITSISDYLHNSNKLLKTDNDIRDDVVLRRDLVKRLVEEESITNPDILMSRFYEVTTEENIPFEITQKLVKIMSRASVEEIINFDSLIANDNTEELLLSINSTINKNIAYYMIGLSGNINHIEGALKFQNKATILALAETGNKSLNYTDLSDYKLRNEVQKRLLIYGHEELYKELFGLEDKQTIYTFASPNTLSEIISEDDSFELISSNVEAFVIYNEKFNNDYYSKLKDDISLVRDRIPVDMFATMEDMNEINRYEVYDYLMDTRAFKDEPNEEVLKAKLISFYKTNNTQLREITLKALNLEEIDLMGVIPNNSVFSEEIRNNPQPQQEEEVPKPKKKDNILFWIFLIFLFIAVVVIIGYVIKVKIIDKKIIASRGSIFS